MNFPLIITHRKLLSKAKLKLFLKLFPKIKSNSIYGLYIEAITAERNFSVELSSWIWSFSFKTWHKHFEKVTNIIEKIISWLIHLKDYTWNYVQHLQSVNGFWAKNFFTFSSWKAEAFVRRCSIKKVFWEIS